MSFAHWVPRTSGRRCQRPRGCLRWLPLSLSPGFQRHLAEAPWALCPPIFDLAKPTSGLLLQLDPLAWTSAPHGQQAVSCVTPERRWAEWSSLGQGMFKAPSFPTLKPFPRARSGQRNSAEGRHCEARKGDGSERLRGGRAFCRGSVETENPRMCQRE